MTTVGSAIMVQNVCQLMHVVYIQEVAVGNKPNTSNHSTHVHSTDVSTHTHTKKKSTMTEQWRNSSVVQ